MDDAEIFLLSLCLKKKPENTQYFLVLFRLGKQW